MIVIFSQEKDLTTNRVIDWLLFHKKHFIRFNEEKFDVKSHIGGLVLTTERYDLPIADITSVWYRRSSIVLSMDNRIKQPDLRAFAFLEYTKLNQYINYILSFKSKINNANDDHIINRLIVSDIAHDLGLQIPKKYLMSSDKQLLDILRKEDLIAKTITGSAMFLDRTNQEVGMIYTNVIETAQINNLNTISYFEKKVKKKYELRIFYLDGRFWSMAIFSQKNKKTDHDFRRYDKEKPNRRIPYKLPGDIEVKLKALFKRIKMNSGSVDMIVTPENEFIFLEINPKGQFGMVSYPCNYNLEREIANLL